MMPVRALLIATLPLVVLSSQVQQCSQFSTTHMLPVLHSLQCYNDYTTHIRCSWEEDPHTLSQLLINSESCNSDGEGELLISGKRYRSCVYKTTVFNWGNQTVFFNTSCPSKETSLNIAQHGKVLKPVNVSEREVVGGGRELSWTSPYYPSSNLTHTLIYQLKYRRHEHDWTVVDDINSTKLSIAKEALLPGYSYEARVRARGQTGLWSNWSPPVTWIIEDEGVFNLQCVIEELGVSCSWQVKEERAQFLSYHLCWKTNKSSQQCQPCTSQSRHPSHHAVLDFTCSVVSSKPEHLIVNLRSTQSSKNFVYGENIQPPPQNPVQVNKIDGLWKLTWSRPDVSNKVDLSYQVRLHNHNTKDYVDFNLTSSDFSLDVLPSSLLPKTTYMAQVRALPCQEFKGRPSEWSEPVFFTSDPGSWTTTITYISIAIFVAIFFIVLYNTLPACHRRFELWTVSIPSPLKSKVLKGICSERYPAGWGNVYSENEKTSMCIIQHSDNPIISKGSVSEYPPFSYTDDLTKLERMHRLDHLSAYVEGSGVSIKSSVSYAGPYILCSCDSSSQTERLDMSFYSSSGFGENSRSIPDIAKESPPENVGYVLSPPTCLPPTEQPTLSDNPTNDSMKPSLSELPMMDPPEYTPNLTARPGPLFSHHSGYCVMPSMETAWAHASNAPAGGDTKSHSSEGDHSARGYVTLSQPSN